jgi:hypothetical protein
MEYTLMQRFKRLAKGLKGRERPVNMLARVLTM